MLSFASKVTSLEGSLSNFGPLGKTISSFVNSNLYDNVPTKNLKLSNIVIDNIYQKDHTVSDFGGYLPIIPFSRISGKNKIIGFEDPGKFDLEAIAAMNTYRFRYDTNIKSYFDSVKDGNKQKIKISHTDVTPALFNPQYGVQTVGITECVPLLNGVFTNPGMNESPYDCSIRKLCSDSLNPNSVLGVATYRIVDFMYCKDLGKVPNNRLITLRRFAYPVGDHIGRFATPQYSDDIYSFDTPGDIGRLISWFDTDDNKLEDICKYEMKMSWKSIESKIQEIDSQEDNQERGLIGLMANTINPRYNSYNESFGGASHNIIQKLGANFKIGVVDNNNSDILRMSSDNNKVYTPKNTVQDTHLYEGKLSLTQEITLNFSYKLRAYDNINPKSAFLDLMGNILNVTYKRGSYWAGTRRLIGPPQNTATWAKANAFIDNAWHKLGGFIEAMAAGTLDWNSIMGAVSNAIGYANDLVNQGIEIAKKIKQDPNGAIQATAQGIQKLNKATGISKYLKGMLKDQLGRPALYAMDSLISGDDCGFWHLTIGNPYNPIMSIGNLIMTSATVQHLGPLGVDDFPSEIKVTVSLQPGRSRDLTEISRYYTKGLNSIYLSKTGNKIKDFHKFETLSSFSDDFDEDRLKAQSEKQQQKSQEQLEQLNNDSDSNSSKNLERISKNAKQEFAGDRYAEEFQKKIAADVSGLPDIASGDVGLKTPFSALIYATNNYSPLYHIRSYDEFDYA